MAGTFGVEFSQMTHDTSSAGYSGSPVHGAMAEREASMVAGACSGGGSEEGWSWPYEGRGGWYGSDDLHFEPCRKWDQGDDQERVRSDVVRAVAMDDSGLQEGDARWLRHTVDLDHGRVKRVDAPSRRLPSFDTIIAVVLVVTALVFAAFYARGAFHHG